jgi:hypothetical protein
MMVMMMLLIKNIILLLYIVITHVDIKELFYIYHARVIPEGVAGVAYYSETATFYQNYLALTNTADVTGGKPIAVRSQPISDLSAVNPLVALVLRHPWKKRRGAILFLCPGHHARQLRRIGLPKGVNIPTFLCYQQTMYPGVNSLCATDSQITPGISNELHCYSQTIHCDN